MKTVFENRASVILYKLMLSNHEMTQKVILVPSNACPIIPLLLLKANIEIEFVDIESNSYCMNQKLVIKRIRDVRKKKVGAILYIRSYGFMDDVSEFFLSIKKTDSTIKLIDDRCLSQPHPTVENLDTMGADIIMYSTGYGKYVDLGFGGFAHIKNDINYLHYKTADNKVTSYNKDSLDKLILIYKQHIADNTRIKPENIKGLLNWLDTSSPAIDWQKYTQLLLQKMTEIKKLKQHYNSIYQEIIPKEAILAQGYHDWRFQILVENKKNLIHKIIASGLFLSDHYYPSSLLFKNEPAPQAWSLYNKIINLFNDSNISEKQVVGCATIVRNHV